MVRLSGGNRNDYFTLSASQLQTLQLRAGRGYDTLKVTGSSPVSLSSAVTSQWRELEALDLSSYTGTMSLAVSSTLLSSSNTRALDITLSTSASLTLSSQTAGVVLRGSGHVQLANGSNNIVTLASAGATASGGNGTDRITASLFGNQLDGGDGNDVLIGNSGADVFVHAASGGTDTLINFNTSQDHLDLSGHSQLNFWDIKLAMTSSDSGTHIALPDGGVFLQGVAAADLTQAHFVQGGAPVAEFGAVVSIATGTSASVINDILARVPDGTTVVFADGTHVLDAPLVLTRGNITIAGESASGTVLQFDLADGTGGNFISIGTGEKTYLTTTGVAAQAGSDSVTLADSQGLAIGDTIYLYQPNTADYLLANGWSNVSFDEAASRPFREFITTVTAISGNTISLAEALPYDFSAGETRLFTLEALEGVSLRDIAITSALGEANTYSFSNTHPEFDGASAIAVTGTIGLHISNVSISDAPSNGLSLLSSSNASVDGLTVSGSHNKGSDGNGYGVLLTETFNSDLSGLAITDTRHAIVFSAWSAETGNSIAADFINRDVNFHGSPDLGNSVTVTQAVLAYDASVDPAVWSLVSSGGSNHAATDIWGDNDVRFAHGEGASNVDTIWGVDGGSYLNGHGSNDVLIGGSGDDMIVGGLRRDTLTGGDGSDTFLFKMGDDLDTVTDMTFGAGGDTLAIMGNVAIDGMEDLVFTQEGADLRVRYGSNSTFILKDTLLSELDAANFIFDPLSLAYSDAWNGGM